MAQDEVVRPENWLSDEVNAYFQRPPGLNFGAIIPKGRFLNISLLGKGFTRDSVDEFITAQNLTETLQYDPSSSMCGCNPRIAVSPPAITMVIAGLLLEMLLSPACIRMGSDPPFKPRKVPYQQLGMLASHTTLFASIMRPSVVR